MNDIYWMRSVDPDNNQSLNGSFTTTNTIVAQPPGDAFALVNATQTDGSYIELNSNSPNARVTHGNFSVRSALDVWNGTGLNNSGSNTADEAISLAVYTASLAAGASTSFTVSYRFIPEVGIVDLDVDQPILNEDGSNTATVTATLVATVSNPVTINLTYAGTAVNGVDYGVTLGTNATSTTQIVIPAGQTSGSVVLTAIPNSIIDGNRDIIVDFGTILNGFAGIAPVTTAIKDEDGPPCEGTDLFFATDFNNGDIHRGGIDGTGLTSFAGIASSPYQVKVDQANGFLYRADFGGGRITKALFDGTAEATLYNTTNPLPIDIDVVNENIYWTSWGGGDLFCAPASGAGPITTVATGLQAVRALAVDNTNNRVFVFENGTAPDQISVAPMPTTCGAMTFTFLGSNNAWDNPFGGMDYDETNDRLFFAENNGQINRFDIGTTTHTQIFDGPNGIWGLAYYNNPDQIVFQETDGEVRRISAANGTGNTLIGTTSGNARGLDICDPLFVATASITQQGAENNPGSPTDIILDVTLSAPNTTPNPITFDVSFSDTTTTGGADYNNLVGGAGAISIGVGATNDTLTIPVSEDMLFENDEIVNIIVSNPSLTGIAINNPQNNGTITDDDNPVAGYTADISATTDGDENSGGAPIDAVITVTLDKVNDTHVPIDFTLAYTDISATGGVAGDYDDSVLVISIPDGASSGTLSIPITDDITIEPTEQFTVTISSPSDPAVTIGTASDTVDIVDDDSSDFQVEVTGLSAFYLRGYDITYVVRVTNNGPSNFTGAAVDHTIPGQLTSVNWDCNITSGNGSCQTPTGTGNITHNVNLDSGSVAEFAVTGIVELPNITTVSFSASVAATGDPVNGNNSDIENIPFRQVAPPAP